MLSLFRTVHLYVGKDSIYWVYFFYGKIIQTGVYTNETALQDIQVNLANDLGLKTLKFLRMTVIVSDHFYKVAILPKVKRFISNDHLKVMSEALFSKKYLDFNTQKYQLFMSQPSYGKSNIFLMLDREVYNSFYNCGVMDIKFVFEAIELLNLLKIEKTMLVSFREQLYYYEYENNDLIDISMITSKRIINQMSSDVFHVEQVYESRIDKHKKESGFPIFVSLLCTK